MDAPTATSRPSRRKCQGAQRPPAAFSDNRPAAAGSWRRLRARRTNRNHPMRPMCIECHRLAATSRDIADRVARFAGLKAAGARGSAQAPRRARDRGAGCAAPDRFDDVEPYCRPRRQGSVGGDASADHHRVLSFLARVESRGEPSDGTVAPVFVSARVVPVRNERPMARPARIGCRGRGTRCCEPPYRQTSPGRPDQRETKASSSPGV